jgi:hypothetical protein
MTTMTILTTNYNMTGNMQPVWGNSDDQYDDYFKVLEEDYKEKLNEHEPTTKSLNVCTPRWLLKDPYVTLVSDSTWDLAKRQEAIEDKIENIIPMEEFVELCLEDGLTDMTAIVAKFKEFFA